MSGEPAARLVGGQPVAEFANRAEPNVGVRAVERHLQRLRHRRRGYGHPGGVACQHDLAFAAGQPPLRGLRRPGGAHPPVGVVVGLIHRHVAVDVGGAGAQAVQERAGED